MLFFVMVKLFMENNPEFLSHSPWINMHEIDWSDFIKEIQPRAVKKGKILYMEHENPEHVFLIKEGRAALSITSDEKEERIVFIADAGMMIGKLSVIDCMPNSCCATVISDEALIYFIPKRRFQEKMDKDLRFCQNVLQLMTKTIRILLLQIKLLTFDNSMTRVCYALIHLVQQYSSRTDDGDKILITFTHEEIGELTGLSRVSVSNILSGMMKDGIIQKKQGFYYVKDIDAIFSKIGDGHL